VSATCPRWFDLNGALYHKLRMDDLELLRLEAIVSFTYDSHGRMLLTNEPFAAARRRAPRVWLGRTLAGATLVRFRADITEPLSRQPPPARAALPTASRDASLKREASRH
jgi:hypothetical protein